MLLATACGSSPSSFSTPVPNDQTLPVAVSPPPATEKIASSANEILVGEVTFTHIGFRTQVTKAFPNKAASNEGHVETVELSLQNLSQPSGSIQTRATINFDRGLDNYVELPTRGGPLRLYLHRDGTLHTEADPVGFTWPNIVPGGPTLSYTGPIEDGVELTDGDYVFSVNLATAAPNPIRVAITLKP